MLGSLTLSLERLDAQSRAALPGWVCSFTGHWGQWETDLSELAEELRGRLRAGGGIGEMRRVP